MLLLPSTANDACLVPERDVEPTWLEKATGQGHREGSPWTQNRVNGNEALATTATNNQAVILHIRPAAGHTTTAEQDAGDMAALCCNDDEAMTRLMRRHAPRLHKVIARMLRDWAEAADVVDEAFLRVYRYRERFDLQARFTTWLYTIAMNLARNRLRHRARQPEFVSLEELNEEELESQQRVPAREPAPDVRLEHEEEMRGMEDSLAALPPQLRESVRLFAYDELSQIEIGSLLHCSAKAVESRLYHARKRLRVDFERSRHLRSDRIAIRPFKPQHKIEIKT